MAIIGLVFLTPAILSLLQDCNESIHPRVVVPSLFMAGAAFGVDTFGTHGRRGWQIAGIITGGLIGIGLIWGWFIISFAKCYRF